MKKQNFFLLPTFLANFFYFHITLANTWCIKEERGAPCLGAAGKCIINKNGLHGGFVANTAQINTTKENNPVFIGLNAQICQNAKILDHARILDNAIIYGNATVKGFSEVSGNAEIYECAQILDHAHISDYAIVYGNATVKDFSKVSGNAEIYEHAQILDHVRILDNVKIYGHAIIKNNAKVNGYAHIFGFAHIQGNMIISGEKHLGPNPSIEDFIYNKTGINKDLKKIHAMNEKIHNESCPICLKDFNTIEKFIITDCKHIFCEKCFKNCIQSKIYCCPLCRTLIEINSVISLSNPLLT